jgi:hypothetical protein
MMTLRRRELQHSPKVVLDRGIPFLLAWREHAAAFSTSPEEQVYFLRGLPSRSSGGLEIANERVNRALAGFEGSARLGVVALALM